MEKFKPGSDCCSRYSQLLQRNNPATGVSDLSERKKFLLRNRKYPADNPCRKFYNYHSTQDQIPKKITGLQTALSGNKKKSEQFLCRTKERRQQNECYSYGSRITNRTNTSVMIPQKTAFVNRNLQKSCQKSKNLCNLNKLIFEIIAKVLFLQVENL